MHSIQSLCKIPKLQYIRRTHDSIFSRTSYETVMCGQVLGDHPGDFSSETRIDKSCDHTNIPHALRIRARKLLMLRVKPRFDSEGISDVDLEVYSHPLWKKFVKKLTPTEKNIFNHRVIRGHLDPKTSVFLTTTQTWQTLFMFFLVRNHMPVLNTVSFIVPDSKILGIHFSFNLMSLPLGGKNNRCTCKSGWITLHSGPDLETRVSHAIAANTLGIHIANTVFAEKTRLGP